MVGGAELARGVDGGGRVHHHDAGADVAAGSRRRGRHRRGAHRRGRAAKYCISAEPRPGSRESWRPRGRHGVELRGGRGARAAGARRGHSGSVASPRRSAARSMEGSVTSLMGSALEVAHAASRKTRSRCARSSVEHVEGAARGREHDGVSVLGERGGVARRRLAAWRRGRRARHRRARRRSCRPPRRGRRPRRGRCCVAASRAAGRRLPPFWSRPPARSRNGRGKPSSEGETIGGRRWCPWSTSYQRTPWRSATSSMRCGSGRNARAPARTSLRTWRGRRRAWREHAGEGVAEVVAADELQLAGLA